MRSFIIISLLFWVVNVFSQSNNACNPPLNIPLNISGNFGELRSNHFHSGVDFKTNEKIGYPVLAVENGYVSRIKISPFGFGKAIYIRHKNGLTSVYAHLDYFNPKIEQYVKNQQYKLKSYDVDLYPEKNDLSVKSGDVIAFSGNSGGSEGPHLHFELRETASEKPVNPLLLGIQISDTLKPIIESFHIYNLYQNAWQSRMDFPVLANSKNVDTIFTYTEFSLGVQAYDRMTDGKNRNGIFNYCIFLDSVKVFDFSFIKFAFDETRYVNAFIDYAYYYENQKRIQTSLVQPGNHLSMYQLNLNNGIISLYDTNYHQLRIEVSDYHENTSSVEFVVKRKSDYVAGKLDYYNLFRYNKSNTFTDSNIVVRIPANALYSNIDFRVNLLDSEYKFSGLFQIGNPLIPLHSNYSVALKPNTNFADSLKSKLCIASLDKNGNRCYEGGNFENDKILVKTRSFGKYYIDIDTVCPEIVAINIQDSMYVTNLQKIQITIKDEFSGIDSYQALLDGEWILFEYDAKNNLLTYYFDNHFQSGEHKLKLLVKDNRANSTEKEWTLFR